VLAGPLVAGVTLIAALWATRAADVPFRDPDNVAAKYLVLVGLGVVVMWALDIFVRAARRTRTRWPSRETLREVRRERWPWRRCLAAASALVSFYVSYLAYRNLKSMVPLLRPDDLFDRELADLDRAVFAGGDPWDLLHSLLGTGILGHVLSFIYVAFIVFLPLSMALALVATRDLSTGLFYTTALSLNWPLGALTYLLVPALGPIYAFPRDFSDLPATKAAELQRTLMSDRAEFLRDPVDAAGQHIAAFVSLHVSMIFTAVVVAYLLGLGRRVRITLLTVLALSVIATVYLGWHYVIDDVAGVGLALVAVWLAWALTGYQPRGVPRLRRGAATVEST
jgi:membrane-associated phospholipid phosphatase